MKKVNLLEYDNYKIFINDLLKSMDNAGRGQFQKMAKYLGVHSTLMSQVFKAQKELNHEQGLKLAQYFSMSSFEQEYFLILISLARAGTTSLKEFYEEKRLGLTKHANELSNILPKALEISESDKSLFYSKWYYSAVRLATTIPSINTIDEIATYLDLPRNKVQEIMDFLFKTGLCERDGEKLISSAKRTHLKRRSPQISSHHNNWRLRAMEQYTKYDDDDLSFTGPMTIATKDANRIREILVESIEKANDVITDSNSEEIFCLCIDWFRFKRQR